MDTVTFKKSDLMADKTVQWLEFSLEKHFHLICICGPLFTKLQMSDVSLIYLFIFILAFAFFYAYMYTTAQYYIHIEKVHIEIKLIL
jgi:hypothetical protein